MKTNTKAIMKSDMKINAKIKMKSDMKTTTKAKMKTKMMKTKIKKTMKTKTKIDMKKRAKTRKKNKKRKVNKLVTHDGSFHSDDIFACATLLLLLQKKDKDFVLFRTRDKKIISEGDFVFDVGGIYDEARNRFDHHQNDFHEKRFVLEEEDKKAKHSFPYSSFGLVWKKFGVKLSGGEKEAKMIEDKLVAPIDAFDNGFDLVKSKYSVSPYYLQRLFMAMRPTWRENRVSNDEMFLKSVKIAREILEREIILSRDAVLAEKAILHAYKKAKDKRIIILDKNYDYEYEVLNNFPELLFIIYPRFDSFFGVKAVRKKARTFANKKNFPKKWGGLREDELVKVSGVSDAVFCHKALFLAVAKSLEGAISLAKKALNERLC